jgi:phenylacetate-CoA ligase
MTHADLRQRQQRRLSQVLELAAGHNPFYRRKLRAAGIDASAVTIDALESLPMTHKEELVLDQESHPPFGSNLTFPVSQYVRCHQTSGTRGRSPLRWLDTAASWSAFLDSWTAVYQALSLTTEDRVFVAFSFGPFIGFWGAFEAAQRLGALTLTGGALSTEQRLHQLFELEATVLVCTPTYALHLVETAQRLGLDLARSSLSRTLHAGEPGASLPAVRASLEQAFGARCFDHAGATELGAWGLPHPEGLLVDEERFIAEIVDPETGCRLELASSEPRRGELVLTNLARSGSPLIRYRTGDLVEALCQPIEGAPRTLLRGGVLARTDDMIVVRGVNVYPAAIENVLRDRQGLAEFRVTIDRRRPLIGISVELETSDPASAGSALDAIRRDLHERLSLRVDVRPVPAGSLPRWELKAKRFRYLD